MMYSNKFVMCVLYRGEVQKEKANGTVTLPFGAEYSLRFRNKNPRRAVVKIYIDGENVSGPGYVVNANDYVDIKRHHDKDRSFKFVSLDSPDAYEHGKNGPNDDKVKGTIEARFYLEKETPPKPIYLPVIQDHHHHHHHHDHDYWPPLKNPYQPNPWYDSTPRYTCGGSGYQAKGSSMGMSYNACSDGGGGTQGSAMPRSLNKTTCDTGSISCSMGNSQPVFGISESLSLQDGCTVEGAASGQRFGTTYIDTEETYTSLKLFLQGYQPEVQTVETNEGPKEVVQNDPNQDTKYCPDCGAKVAKKTAKFCHNCGSKL